MSSNWFEKEHTDERQVSFEPSDCPHKIKQPKRFSRMYQNRISDHNLDLKQSSASSYSLIRLRMSCHINLASNVEIHVLDTLSDLNQCILNFDRVELNLGP
jgi:hypothetical protein